MLKYSSLLHFHFLAQGRYNLLFVSLQCYCMKQIDGSWKVKNENLSTLYKVAKELKDKFVSFKISHVLRVGTVYWTLVVYGISFGFILAIYRVP
jgi:hypothetical protein